MPRSSFAYLYVISSDAFDPLGSCVKVGRSTSPGRRRSELQVGQGGKLAVIGQWKVAAQDASHLEGVVKRALYPLRVKGEVFRASDTLACAVVEWIASHQEPDDLICVAVAHEEAALEWARLDSRPSASGRRATPEGKAATEAAWQKLKLLCDQMFALNYDRAFAIDPFSAPNRNTTKQEAHRDRV